MPRFLMEGKFTVDGLQGLQKDGGSLRREAVQKAAESLGGHLDSFYFALGKFDTYSVVDLPDTEAAAAFSLAVGSAGAVMTRMVTLLTPDQIDTATSRSVDYRAPGR